MIIVDNEVFTIIIYKMDISLRDITYAKIILSTINYLILL